MQSSLLKTLQESRSASSHLGQRALRTFTRDRSCSARIQAVSCSLGGPPAHLLSDRQIHPHCLKTNGPIHPEAPIDKQGEKYSTNAWKGSGEWVSGPAIFLRTLIGPPPCPTCFHWRVTGDRHEWGGLRAPWQEARRERMGHGCLHLHGSSGQSHRGG